VSVFVDQMWKATRCTLYVLMWL